MPKGTPRRAKSKFVVEDTDLILRPSYDDYPKPQVVGYHVFYQSGKELNYLKRGKGGKKLIIDNPKSSF